VGDRWFLYYTAAASGHDDDAHRGIFVLENAAADPTTGQWVDRGRVNTRLPGIDATVFAYRGRRYLVYSAYDGPDSVLAIARMANPWTLEPGETVIARPDRAWERQGGRQILEGPAFLEAPRGDLFLSYSGSACWSDDYAIGLLRARPGSDPLDPAAWTKAPGPVLAKSPAAGIYATGHNGFFTGPGGRGNWIIFHANPGPGMGCGRRRSPRIAQVKWTVRGLPVFAAPVRDGLPMPAPGAGR
jgi:GH43 family beta-xylosidase